MSADKSAMITRRRDLLGSTYRLFYDEPVHIVRGEGVWLYDADGNKYLDMYNNVPHVGHCHPQVVEAITKQLGTLNTHTRYLHENVIELAERLTGKFPQELDNVMFSCTGSEANELALRIARTVTGGTGIIVTVGKPMGNGHPIAATIASSELIDEFSTHSHYFNTFGGNPVSCAAGLAVLDVIEQEDLQRNALTTGQYLTDGLTKLAEKHAAIGDIRGSGFFKAVELVSDRESRVPAKGLAANMVNALRNRGVLIGAIGPHDNILKLRPPMVFSQDNADYFLGVLDDVLDTAQ